jgi:hypothetical protein
MALTYEQIAVRDGLPYVGVIHYVAEYRFPFGNTNQHWILCSTLDEAMDRAVGSEHAEVLAVDELIPGSIVVTKLATVLVGEWFIHNEEITMAKVKEVKKNGAKIAKGAKEKAALDELLGSGKSKKAATTRKSFEDGQRIKVLKKYDGTPREGSNLALSLGVLKHNITIGDWNKARAKAGVENVGFGYLHKLVNEGYVKVV